jgi:chromosomal replication initiation ATPase DnaA
MTRTYTREVTPQGVIMLNRKLNQMKKRIFNKYVDKICEAYYIDESELFTKDKRTDLADARHLLYYLSLEAPMTIAQLRKYMKDNDYNISHSSIYHGYNKIKLLTETNDDMQDIVKSIRKECIN